MNRRQKKKKFKKKYGMSPKEYERWEREEMPKIIAESEKIIEAVGRVIGEAAKEAVKLFEEGLAKCAEEIRVAAGFLETENMLRKSNLLPEGTDKELLKHIGIRVDRYGYAYDFYYDEANEEYFVEYLQKGGERNENIMDDSANVGNGLPDCVGGNGFDNSDCVPGSSSEELV